MEVGALIILLIILSVISFMAGVSIENDIEGTIFFCVIAIGFVVLVSAIHADYVDKLETFGTYPDTTVSIKNGVRDTSIIYKIKERE